MTDLFLFNFIVTSSFQVNAIEHGNLNVSYDDKSIATVDGNYIEYILSHWKDPRFRDKR